MASVCSPSRSGACPPAHTPSPAPSSPHPLSQALQALHALRALVLRPAAHDLSSWRGPSSSRHRRHLQSAESYMTARLGGRTSDILPLVSEDVTLRSSRDGVYSGKESFSNYLTSVKPSGTWRKPTWNSAIGQAEVLGNVRILMLNVNVVAQFGFNRQGKINRIYVGTLGKAHK